MSANGRPSSRLFPMPSSSSSNAASDRRQRPDAVDSWVDVTSQPSSSMSSVDEIVTIGLRVQDRAGAKPHRQPSKLHHSHLPSTSDSSSQEEYEESESESEKVMTSSGEGAMPAVVRVDTRNRTSAPHAAGSGAAASDVPVSAPHPHPLPSDDDDDDDDDHRTAVNYPTNHPAAAFTPQPHAFSYPPNQHRHASQPAPASYSPSSRPSTQRAQTTRNSLSTPYSNPSHLPQNPLSPSYNPAAEYDEALRASLNNLLSVAAATRGLSKTADPKHTTTTLHARSNRMNPESLRMFQGSAPPSHSSPSPPQQQEPLFQPTLRRHSTSSTSTTSAERQAHLQKESRRKTASPPPPKSLGIRNSSRERRAASKKTRRNTHTSANTGYENSITPTFFTWVVSAGLVVIFSALSFRAGYVLGKENGRFEALAGPGGAAVTGLSEEQLKMGAREAGRSGLGLKRTLARSAIMV